MNEEQKNTTYTVRELARQIRTWNEKPSTNVIKEIPSRIKVINGNVLLTEGANIGLIRKK